MKRKSSNLIRLFLTAAILVGSPLQAYAQSDYLNKPIRLIIASPGQNRLEPRALPLFIGPKAVSVQT
jgi:hypothetical protein